MKKLLLLAVAVLLHGAAIADPKPKPAVVTLDSATLQRAYRAYADSVNGTLSYQQGHIVLPGNIGELTVPRGFRYLDSAQSRRLLTQIWHNLDGSCLGMLLPANRGPLSENSWAYVIEFDGMGYVKDDDADDIDYSELLEDMQKDTEEANEERVAAGYEPVHLIGWASNPYYDKEKHTLHWAKTLRFGGDSAQTTLNYNVRLLGRKGVLVLNAVGEPGQIDEIKASIPDLLSGVTFVKGQQYADFDAGLDDVAAYGIGGLVAGKVLAKVGFFAIILKFWKLGLIALAGAWAAIKRFFGFGSKEA
jgi:uncharacterized membrane-anchored protein